MMGEKEKILKIINKQEYNHKMINFVVIFIILYSPFILQSCIEIVILFSKKIVSKKSIKIKGNPNLSRDKHVKKEN